MKFAYYESFMHKALIYFSKEMNSSFTSFLS